MRKKTLDVKDKPAEKVLALPDGIKLTKVTEIDARKPKNKVTKKNNNKKSDSSSSDDTTSGGTPTGGTPTGTNPTNNQGGTTDDTKTKKQPKKKAETKTKATSRKAAVTEYINETPQNERGQMEEIEAEENLRNNETPQRDMVEEAPKNKVTSKKAESKAAKDPELREKIGDRFYDYLQKQVDIINENRKEFGKEPITVEDLNLNDDLYINKFEKIAQKELSEIQNELSEINKDLPKAPALTESQKEQLNKAENQAERNKLLRKWQDEWLESNPISEEKAEQIREIMERAADIIEQHNKARNYIYELEEAEENKEYEDKYSEQIEAEKTKKKESKEIDAKTRKKILAGDGVLIFSSGEFKFIPSLEQGLIRLTRKEGEAKLREQIESAFDDSRFHVNIWGDEDGNTYVYNEGRQDLQDLEEETTWETIIDKENYKDFKLLPNGDIEFELDPDATFEGFKDLTVDLQDFLNNSRISRYAVTKKAEKEANNKVTTTEKNKITNTQPVDIEYLEEIDPQTLKILKDMGDKAAIKLYEEMGIEDDALEQLYLDMERERLGDNAPSIFEDEAIYQNNQSDNETAQIPTIFEEDLQESNLRNLDENETAQTTEEEVPKNKVTAKKVEESKPKNLVTSKVEENNNTDSKAEQIFNTSMEQLKGAKKVSLGALGKVKQTEVKLDNGTTVTYIDSSVGKGISQNAIIRVNSPEAGYKTYVVTKIPNNPAEIREGGNVLTDEQIDKVYDILQGKTGEVKVEDMKVDTDKVENKKDPVNAFLDNNEAIQKDPKLKYKYLSRLNDQTSWIDYDTGVRYKGTVAEKVQQTIDNFGKRSDGTSLPIKFTKNNYGNYIEVGSWDTGMASRDIGDDIEFEYAKFLYDNPEIRSTKEFKADGIKEAIKKGNEIHKEVVKDAEEQKGGIELDPEKYIWQQPTADEGINAVYEQVKRISDYFEAKKESEVAGNPYGYGTEYREKVKAAQNALWSKLQFKSSRSKLYNDFIKNIRESNGNEKQLQAIAKNLYIQKVKDDFKNNYNYPSEVTDKVPGLRTAKDNYERYLKGRDTSFSGKDPRIDYSDKDRIGAGIKRQDGNQITAAQRREIVNGVLEYAKYMGIDMKKMSEDAGITYVHLNGKHPFLTKSAVGLFHGLFKSVSVGADAESYTEKGKGRDAKMETHTVPVVMAHEITHAIDSMFEWDLFSDQKTRIMSRKMNEGRSLGDYWHRKAEITARMVEEYVDVMKGGEGYYNMRGYWDKDTFNSEIKPYVEQIFSEKFDGYKLTDKERNEIKLDEAPSNKNSVTASDLNKVTNKVNAERVYSPTITVRLDENGNPIKKNDKNLISNKKNKVTSRAMAEAIPTPTIRANTNNILSNGVTRSITPTVNEIHGMKTRRSSIIKTADRRNNIDILSRLKQQIQNDLGINVIDGYKIRGSELRHSYKNHAYDTELGYGKSITAQDLQKIPDILENYNYIMNTTDSNGNPTNFYELHRDDGNIRYNLVIEITPTANGGDQVTHKTFFINDAAGRRNYNRDKRAGLVTRKRRQVRQQYGDRFHL